MDGWKGVVISQIVSLLNAVEEDVARWTEGVTRGCQLGGLRGVLWAVGCGRGRVMAPEGL